MGKLLYLVHRLPYPPNKGDKLRSYHLLQHLAAKHSVFLGTFVDDPEDEAHIDTVRALCAELHVSRLDPRRTKLASLAGLWRGEPLTLSYYRSRSMARWVKRVATENRFDAAVVFSSSMAQYAEALDGLPVFVDFVDVDSAKWAQYAHMRSWPLSWLYRREGEQLLQYERQTAARSTRSFFVTENESAMFRQLAPESAETVEAMGNGVDTAFFAPQNERPNPFRHDEIPLVFTGAMDYWPNIDAVTWFAHDVLPALSRQSPLLRFYIVGRNPPAAVQALACENVVVTGTVPDVRPYLQHAAVVVAPLRLARGIQNKILEAMAMGRPVVAASECVEATEARVGAEILAAKTAEEFARQIRSLLEAPERAAAIGAAGRTHVASHCSWAANLGLIDRHLDSSVLSRSTV